MGSPYGPTPGQYIGQESERGRAFYPNDNPQELSTVDWKSRYQEYQNQAKQEWDPQKQFWGLPRLGDRYHPLDPFFKFEGTPRHMQHFDKIWWPLIGAGGGLIATGMGFMTGSGKRPLTSSLPVYLAMGIGGALAGKIAYDRSKRKARERDAVLIHYALLHEKELPIIERKRFGQFVRPWYPFRPGHDGFFVDPPEDKQTSV